MSDFPRHRHHRSSYLLVLTFSAVCSIGLLATSVVGQSDNQEYSVRLTGDHLEGNLNNENATWVLSGNVQLIFGDSHLNAAKMTVLRAEGNLATVEAEGEPVRFQQTQPHQVIATAKSIRFMLADQKLVLQGEVELTQGGNVVRGSEVEYDLGRGELIASSDASDESQQIEFVLETD